MVGIAAENQVDTDAVLEGFDLPGPALPTLRPSEPTDSPSETKTATPFSSHVFGSLRFESIYALRAHSSFSNNTDFHGITSFKPILDLGIEARYRNRLSGLIRGHGYYDFAFRFNGIEKYNSEIRDAYGDELSIDEAYLTGHLTSKLDLKIGRQIVSLGKASLLPVIDHLNPVDLRKPGLVDIDYYLLPVGMSRVDFSHNHWRFTGIATHEFRTDKYPPYGSDFYPFTFNLPPVENIETGLDHQSYGLFAGGLINGLGINLALASFLDEQPLIGLTEDISLRRVNRHHLVGISLDRVFESWLLKAETAYSDNRQFYALPNQKVSQIDTLFGVEYTGFRHTFITFELLYRYLYNLDLPTSETDGLPEEHGLVWALSLSRHFFHDLLKLSFYTYNLGLDFSNGALYRFATTYALTDRLSIGTGVIIYQGGNNYLMENIGSNDRLFLNVSYRF